MSDLNLKVHQLYPRSIATTIISYETYVEEPLFLCKETLEKFVLVDAEMLNKIISQLRPAACILDPIPASFLKKFVAV